MKLTNSKLKKQTDKAKKMFADGAHQEAVTLLRKCIEEVPDAAVTYRMLGSMLSYSPAQDEALKMLQKALELAPQDVENWIALGFLYKKNHLFNDAIKAFREALNQEDSNIEVLRQIFWLSVEMKKNKTLLEIAPKLLTLDKENTLSISETYARALLEEGKREEALQTYKRIVYEYSFDISIFVIQSWYNLMLQNNYSTEAQEFIFKLYHEYPSNIRFKLFYAITLLDVENYAQAVSLFREIHNAAADNFEIQSLLGKKFEETGHKKEAIKCYETAFLLDNTSIDILYNIGRIHSYTYGDKYFRQLNLKAASLYKMTIEEQTTLHYALGKAYEDVDNLTLAFEHYRLAGNLRSNSGLKTKQELIKFKTLKTSMIKQVSKSFFEKIQGNKLGYRSDKPVFIVGMPRSGTTLMEQVLSSLEGVHGAGELNYISTVLKEYSVENDLEMVLDYTKVGQTYMEMLNTLVPKYSKRIVDKMPDNFKNIGYIALMFPDAYIIHAKRHPVETCLSAYRINFAQGHYWADELRMMGQYYRLYTEIMAYWKHVLPEGRILDVRYEDMVKDLEKESKRLAKHIDMPWNEHCLSFHKQKGVVRTASVMQVRQPIYKTSVNRWHRYEPWLKPLLDEIGDLVDDYEEALVQP